MDKIKRWISCFFDFRFEILALILVWIVFGGNLFSGTIFHDILFPISVFILIGASITMVKNERKGILFLFLTFAILMFFIALGVNFTQWRSNLKMIALIIPFVFFVLLSIEVFRQMLLEKNVTHSIIIAAFDCYLLLGILGATLFTIIIHFNPNAYSNIDGSINVFDKMLYFSFITLTSIGYGDITPVTPLAEKITAFFGLIGHFYSVVVVGYPSGEVHL